MHSLEEVSDLVTDVGELGNDVGAHVLERELLVGWGHEVLGELLELFLLVALNIDLLGKSLLETGLGSNLVDGLVLPLTEHLFGLGLVVDLLLEGLLESGLTSVALSEGHLVVLEHLLLLLLVVDLLLEGGLESGLLVELTVELGKELVVLLKLTWLLLLE